MWRSGSCPDVLGDDAQVVGSVGEKPTRWGAAWRGRCGWDGCVHHEGLMRKEAQPRGDGRGVISKPVAALKAGARSVITEGGHGTGGGPELAGLERERNPQERRNGQTGE